MNSKHPPWIRRRAPKPSIVAQFRALMEGLQLHTVCESALCPNLGDCFLHQTATFLIMGNICTRNCSFCAIEKGYPFPLSPSEPDYIAQAVSRLKLRHVVITSVTRDDLPDGGASHFAKTIQAIKPLATVEVLIPDFQGSQKALKLLIEKKPEVIGHNIETVPRLYPHVRPGANYNLSLRLLKTVKDWDRDIITKSSLILGLGEKHTEVVEVMKDLREAGCEILTLGQYLRATLRQQEVVRYVPPEEFKEYEDVARQMGFISVVSAPFVRSSFRAAEMYRRVIEQRVPSR